MRKLKTHNSTLPSVTKCKDGYNWLASFEFYPLAVGHHKSSFEARMYIPGDYWSKTKAVVKLINGRFGEEKILGDEIRISEIANDYAVKFHKIHGESRFRRKLSFVRPFLSVVDSVSIFNSVFRVLKRYEKCFTEGEFVLIEPFIGKEFTNLIYFNGVVSSCCPEFLQTFCHFSYFESNGEFVISNLQGTFSETSILLSSPRICSRDQRFGDRDMGEKGIFEFFSHHKCNATCKNWPKPTDGPMICPTAPYSSECELLDKLKQHFDSSKNLTKVQIHNLDVLRPLEPPPYQFINHFRPDRDFYDEKKVYGIEKSAASLPVVHSLCLKDSWQRSFCFH